MSARLAPFLQASAFAFRSFPLLFRLPLAFAPLGNKRHHHHLCQVWVINVIIIIVSLLRYHWTSQGWDDPLESPYLSPFFGDAGEECADDFVDEGFSTGYFDQA